MISAKHVFFTFMLGLINGVPAENGNYIIIVRAISLSGKEIDLNGPVMLVR